MAEFKMNVERTLNAFTSGTYQVHEAMYEFVDNSEAADAKKVHIIVEKGNKEPVEKIIVSDDGSGMTAGELEASLEFAGEIRERGNFEVSEFGVGMKAAAFSLAGHFTVITKSCNGNISGAFLDRERINKDQEFGKTIRDMFAELLLMRSSGLLLYDGGNSPCQLLMY